MFDKNLPIIVRLTKQFGLIIFNIRRPRHVVFTGCHKPSQLFATSGWYELSPRGPPGLLENPTCREHDFPMWSFKKTPPLNHMFSMGTWVVVHYIMGMFPLIFLWRSLFYIEDCPAACHASETALVLIWNTVCPPLADHFPKSLVLHIYFPRALG